MAATASIEKKNIPLVSSIDQQAAAEAAIAIEQSLYDKGQSFRIYLPGANP